MRRPSEHASIANFDALMAELSNLLHHPFRLRELGKRRPGKPRPYATERTMPDLRAARAASWARNFDTHQLFSCSINSRLGWGVTVCGQAMAATSAAICDSLASWVP
jgi:hypothetical protein